MSNPTVHTSSAGATGSTDPTPLDGRLARAAASTGREQVRALAQVCRLLTTEVRALADAQETPSEKD